MDKSTYLKQLEAALREKYPQPQVQDILADYEDFFTTGMAEGKSEAELCTEFGSPEQAARELKSESETGIPQRSKKRSALAISILAILLVVIIWQVFGPTFDRVRYGPHIPDGPINFWLAMLFPLVLESILILWASQGVLSKRAFNWVPRMNIIFAVPVTVVLILLVSLTLTIPWAAESYNREGPFGFFHFLTSFAYYGSIVSMILLFVSVILLMLYTMHGHEKARWFLFLDTTLLTAMLNHISVLSHICSNTWRSGSYQISMCFLWAILPNLAAMGIYWIIQKVISTRKPREAKAWTGK